MIEPSSTESVSSGGLPRWTRWTLGLVGVLLLVAGVSWVIRQNLYHPVYEWFRTDFSTWLEVHPILAPFTYILIYILAVVLFIPASVITLIGGGVFGPIWGLVYVSLASTVGAGLAFLVARYLAAEWLERRASGMLIKLKRGIEAEGWRFVAFTRLVPLFPFNLLNYMFGLTRVPFWMYFFVSWICMLPGTFAYVYAGYAGRRVVFGEGGWGTYLTYGLSAVGLLIFVSMLPRWIRRFRSQPVEEVLEEVPSAGEESPGR